MPRSPRIRIAPNIYQDAGGIAAVARVAGARPTEHRFPLGTSLRTMTRWLEKTRAELRADIATRGAVLVPGTLAAAVHRYLMPFAGARRRDLANLLQHWVTALGPATALRTVTVAHLRAAVEGWRAAGHATSSLRHRRRALIAFFESLQPGGPNPARQVQTGGRGPESPIRALPIELAERLINALPEITRLRVGERRDPLDRSKTKARLRVMLWTGLPQATLMRVTPMDVDLEQALIRVRPRRKGRGAPATVLPLTPEGVDACRAFLRAGAWGRFSTKSMAQSFHRAIARVLKEDPELPIPRTWRPYDLRHTWLSYVLEVTGDEAAVAQLAQHTDRRTTQRYVKRAQEIRARLAIDTIAHRRKHGT